MLPILVLKDLAEDPQPGLGHAVWMMTGAPILLLIGAGTLMAVLGKHTKSGRVAFLGLLGGGVLGLFAVGAFFKGCTELGEDHVAPLFSDNSPANQQAFDLYIQECREARRLGYGDDMRRYYREHPPQHDDQLREPVRHKLEDYRWNGVH